MIKCSSISPALQFCVNSLWPDSRQKRPWTPAIVVMFCFVNILYLTLPLPHPVAVTESNPRLTDPFPVAYQEGALEVRADKWEPVLGFSVQALPSGQFNSVLLNGATLGVILGLPTGGTRDAYKTPHKHRTCSKDSFCPKRCVLRAGSASDPTRSWSPVLCRVKYRCQIK